MEQIKELHEVAAEGSVPGLLDLLDKDRFILDRCMAIPYGETPLHIAVMFGHLEFCKELLKRKPELAEELDFRKSSALHLASYKGFTDIVKVLVSVRPKMSFAYDEDGKTPIHVAAMKGRVEVLKELVDIQPDAAHRRVEMCQGETVLHLCVQYSQLEALRFLVENINDEQLLNAKDDNGNSILHLAVSDRQIQIVKYLLENTKVDLNASNSNGLTALEILGHTRKDSKYIEIFQCLHSYVSQSSNGISSSEQVAKHPSRKSKKLSISKDEKKASKLTKSESMRKKETTTWIEGQQNSIIIVAILIATVGFQGALTPPGGFYQEDTILNTTSGNVTLEAGTSIFATKQEYGYIAFMSGNTVGFISSLSVILILLSGLPYKRKTFMWIFLAIMWTSITAMAFTYIFVVLATSTNNKMVGKIISYVIYGWLTLLAVVNFIHLIFVIIHRMRKWSSKLRVGIWTLMIIIWISITSLLYYSVSGIAEEIGDKEGKNISLKVCLAAIMGWLTLLPILAVVVLVRAVHKLIRSRRTIKRVMTTAVHKVKNFDCRRFISGMTCSRNHDNAIVV